MCARVYEHISRFPNQNSAPVWGRRILLSRFPKADLECRCQNQNSGAIWKSGEFKKYWKRSGAKFTLWIQIQISPNTEKMTCAGLNIHTRAPIQSQRVALVDIQNALNRYLSGTWTRAMIRCCVGGNSRPTRSDDSELDKVASSSPVTPPSGERRGEAISREKWKIQAHYRANLIIHWRSMLYRGYTAVVR